MPDKMVARNRLFDHGLHALLWWRSRPAEITRTLAYLPYCHAAPMNAGQVTVGAIQMHMALVTRAGEYAQHIYRLIYDAVERGAQIVAFPEYSFLPLLGLLPGIARIAHVEMHETLDAVHPGLRIADVFRMLAPAAYRIYAPTFSQLAQRFGIYIMAGSIITMDDTGRLFNCAHLYAPDGRLLARQEKLHPFTSEEGWLTPGDVFHNVDLPCGRIAMPVCMDHTYWETARLAYLNGVEILFDPSAGGSGEREWYAARGVRMRVQEALCYGVHINGVTDLFGLHWRGRSSVYAPVALLPSGECTVARAQHDDREEVVMCTLDLQALREYRATHRPEFNDALIAKYLPQAYHTYRSNRSE